MATEDLASLAKQFYKEYRENNQNLFAENMYLFFPEHYQGLNYSLAGKKPDLSSSKYEKDWDNIIKKQLMLEESVLSSLGVSFAQLQSEILKYKPTEDSLKDQLLYNQQAANIIQEEISQFLADNQVFLSLSGEVKVITLLKQHLSSQNNRLYQLLSNLYDRVEASEASKNLKVTTNILNKILSYGYLANEDTVEEARTREKRNILKKQYTINQVITSITNSLSGTLNNIGSEYDETIVNDFLNKRFLDIKINGDNIVVNAKMPTGGKKVKADVHATIITKGEKTTTTQFGISNKIGSGQNIKLHSGGNIDALIKWIAAYKGTEEISNFLKSDYFRFMLANEINAGAKGEAWETLQQIMRITLYIWIGNEFMMRDNALARKLFGEKVGNYNIAFICSNKKLIRVSTILQNFKKINFSKYVNVTSAKTSTGTYWSQKRDYIKTLPTYYDYTLSNESLDNYPYPQELLDIGKKASKDILKRITYTINMNKNLLQL